MGKRKTYKKLKTLLEKTLLLKKDIKNLKPEDKILAIEKGEGRWKNNCIIGTVKQTKRERTFMEWCLIYYFYDNSTTIMARHHIEIKEYYKIKKCEPIQEIIERGYYEPPSFKIREMFKIIQKELEETPEHKFITMDQTLPIEMEQKQPEKRLKLTKKLEAILEKEAEKTNCKDTDQMLNMKKLFTYAQNCGVVSTKAKEQYKEKRQELKKAIRELDNF